MKELGSYLKRTRVFNGVSLDEAADDLELSVAQLENIECGNTKAFKDIYKLKVYVKKYAKYLGLNPDKVMDEFNQFLFNHTSKISLQDIKDAKARSDLRESEKKVHSPYTIIKGRKFNYVPIVIWVIVIVFVILVSYFILDIIRREPVRNTELDKRCRVEELYEFTY